MSGAPWLAAAVAAAVVALLVGAYVVRGGPAPSPAPSPAPKAKPAPGPARRPARKGGAAEPFRGDRMGPHGPEVDRAGLRRLAVPDHEPLEN